MRAGQPIIIHHRKLRARKEYLGLRYTDLATESGCCEATLATILKGRTELTLQSLIDVAGAMGMGVIVDFVPLEEKPVDLAAQLRDRMREGFSQGG